MAARLTSGVILRSDSDEGSLSLEAVHQPWRESDPSMTWFRLRLGHRGDPNTLERELGGLNEFGESLLAP